MTIRTMAATLALMLSAPVAASEQPELPNWLHGAWNEARAGGRWADEYWTPPRGGLMIGAARMGNGDRIVVFEHSRIVRMPGGTLVFVAQPFGNSAVHFPMVAAGDQMLEFANPEHDYPQRIRYWREGRELRARVSLMDGSKAMEWRYQPMGGSAE